MRLIPLGGKGNEYLFRHPKTGIIYYQQSKAGKGRPQRSCKTDKPSVARRKRDDFQAELLGLVKEKKRVKLIEDLFPEWINQKKSSFSVASIASVYSSWKHLETYAGGMLPNEITASWWEGKYIPEKRLDTHPGRKFFNDRKWLSMFLLYCHREGIIERRPILINPDPPRKPGKVYSEDEIDKLFLHSDTELELQILMAITMAMRLSEIMLLSWDRVDLKSRVIHLRAEDTKIRKARSFAISGRVYSALKSRKKNSPWVFPNPADLTKPQGRQGNKRAWSTCRLKAKVKGRFHDLRHTFLTRTFKAHGANPALICHYAGLSMEEAQRTYLHFNEEDTRGVAKLIDID